MKKLMIRRLQLLTVALTCLGIGAGASAIASADATNTTANRAHVHRPIALRRLAGRVVEGSFVVATKSGFITVNVSRGTVQTVSGQTLTLVEGTRTKSYRTVTLTLPANAKVRDNRQSATLSQVTAGQRATVVIGPGWARVWAHTPR
jgi:hypothetical protein